MTTVGGIVLCGGQSKRMGRPKAWLPFGDELLLQRIVRILGSVVQPITVVAAANQEVPTLPAGVILAHDAENGRGPLQGLAAGLAALEGRCDTAFLSSCDVPLLQPNFVKRMIELLGDHAICVPHVDDRYHPLAAVYRVNLYGDVCRLLAANRLRPVFLFEEMPTRIVQAHELSDLDPELQSLRNVNTPEEYAAALLAAGFTRAETGGPDHDG